MRFFLAVLALLFCVLVPAAAHAHSVPGDPDPGDSWYILPGQLAMIGGRACCVSRDSESGFIDVGVEVSAHRFVREGATSIFTQPGYGALAQVSLEVPLAKTPLPDEPGTNLRVALGGQATVGPLGAQAGLVTRLGDPTYGSSLGAFVGGFFSIGILSVGVQVEAPMASLSGGRLVPLLVTCPFTMKWPIVIKDKDPTSSRTSS